MRFLLSLLLLILPQVVIAQSVTGPQSTRAPLNLCTDNQATCAWPYKVNVSDGTLTCANGVCDLDVSGTPTTPGGSSGQVQYNNAGAFGGFGNWDGTILTIPQLILNGSAAGSTKWYESAAGGGTNYVGFKSPDDLSVSTLWTLPSADASGFFKSNGSGSMSIDTTTYQTNLNLVAGTYADGKMCTYTASGTLLNCNTDIPTGTVTSSATTGYMPYMSSSTALSNSATFYEASTTNTGIGITSAIPNKFSVISTVSGDGISIDNAAVADGIDANTITMLHFDGSNASTIITDSEITPKTWTANGNAKISTAQFKFGGASGLFDGAGDTVSTPTFTYSNGTASFTIDFWVRFNALTECVFFNQRTDGNSNNYLRWRGTGLNRIDYINVSGGSTQVNLNFPFTPSTNTWYHIEFGRDSTNAYYGFINGVSQTITYATGSASTSVTQPSATVYIGGREGGAADLYLDGYLDEFRVSNIIRHTSNFTPPTSAYTAAVNKAGILLRNAGTLKWNILDNGSTSDNLNINNASGATWLNLYQATGQLTFMGSAGACLMLQDTDVAGYTECDALNGTLSCSLDADGVCD